MNYGVVVVTYNRVSLLGECIKCIENQTIKPYKVFIVDNGSTDGTKEYLGSLGKDNYIVIGFGENMGASRGFSEGISEICKEDVDYVLVIDADAHIDKDYVLRISEFLERHHDVKAASGTVYEQEKIALSHRRRLKNKLTLADMCVPENEYEGEVFYYDLFSFCGIFLSKELLIQAGYPRSDFFTQYTDTDFSLRIRKYTRIANVNNAALRHKVKAGASAGKISYKFYYQVRNRMVTILSNSGKLLRPIIRLGFIMSYNMRILGRSFMLVVQKDNIDVLKFQKQVFRDALRDVLSNNMGANKKYLPDY